MGGLPIPVEVAAAGLSVYLATGDDVRVSSDGGTTWATRGTAAGLPARQLLGECGQTIRRLVAGLTMPDWPEGARRAISFSFFPMVAMSLPGALQMDTMLESFREADGITFDNEGD